MLRRLGIKSTLRKQLTNLYRKYGYWNGNRLSKPYTGEQANALLKQAILGEEPFLFSRFGTELLLCNFYLKGKGYRKLVDKAVDNIGVFPKTQEAIDHFCKEYIESIRHIDYLNTWFWLKSEGKYFRKYCSKAVLLPSDVSYPFFRKDSWTQSLSGKKVLVIHSAPDTIRNQYQRREYIWGEKEFLPEFDLITYRAVQSLGGEPTEYSEWLDALKKMREDISKLDFDIAILGCGAYGLPLGAFIKDKMNKQALHLGGITQIYFGIKGKRWEGKKENYNYDELLYNEYWVRTDEGKPKSFQNVENGCYW